MQSFFFALADYLQETIGSDEFLNLYFEAEDSRFVRFASSAIRQAGTVRQRYVEVQLVQGAKCVVRVVPVAGVLRQDRHRLRNTLLELRQELVTAWDDPHMRYSTDPQSSEQRGEDHLPPDSEVLDDILAPERAVSGADLVGMYAAGPKYCGFANSLGQRNWFSNYSFHLDWSLHADDGRAVKRSLAGERWDSDEYGRQASEAARHLGLLATPQVALSPGEYRAYLAPEALQPLIRVASVGFGIRARESGTSPLIRMVREGAQLDERVHVMENIDGGCAPRFDSRGFVKPDNVELVRGGAIGDPLVSPRSAAEYGVESNGAAAMEVPLSLEMSAGTLAADAVLKNLDTGLYISRLHYVNLADRESCGITGLTRFACFWVNGGVVEGPIPVMRFDDSLYRILGDQVEDLTDESTLIRDSGTYGGRSVMSHRLPGVLVREFSLKA